MARTRDSASPLTELEHYFRTITTEPTKLLFDGTGFAGLPRRLINPVELRTRLLAGGQARLSRDTVDEVWRDLVRRARQPKPQGDEWTVVAIGMAVPGLKHRAGELTAGWRGDTSDIDAAMLEGFHARLRTVDLDAPRVLGKLIDAAMREGAKARAEQGDQDLIRVDQSWSRAPMRPWDHPDWVLDRALTMKVIDRTEHRLLGDTFLDERPIAAVAAGLRLHVHLALDWRRLAAERLRQAILAGDLDHAPTHRDIAERRRALQRAVAKLARAHRRARLARMAGTADASN